MTDAARDTRRYDKLVDLADRIGGADAPTDYDHAKWVAEYEAEHGVGSYERDYGDGMVAT